jgi:hypothetical protein
LRGEKHEKTISNPCNRCFVCVGSSGCDQITRPGIELTNIGYTAANPQKYVYKEVTIEGLCQANAIIDDNGHLIYYQLFIYINGEESPNRYIFYCNPTIHYFRFYYY